MSISMRWGSPRAGGPWAVGHLSQALKYVRDVGFAKTDDEAREEENRAMLYRPKPKSLYPMLGPRC
jgi:hypothetical protein